MNPNDYRSLIEPLKGTLFQLRRPLSYLSSQIWGRPQLALRASPSLWKAASPGAGLRSKAGLKGFGKVFCIFLLF